MKKIQQKNVRRIVSVIVLFSVMMSSGVMVQAFFFPPPPPPPMDPPEFTSTPSDETIYTTQSVTMTWKASSDATQTSRVAKIYVDGDKKRTITDWNNDQSLSYTVTLYTEGTHTVECYISDAIGSTSDTAEVDVLYPDLYFNVKPANNHDVYPGDSISLVWQPISSPILSDFIRSASIKRGTTTLRSFPMWENNQGMGYTFHTTVEEDVTFKCEVTDGFSTIVDYVSVNVELDYDWDGLRDPVDTDDDNDGISDDRENNVLLSEPLNEHSPFGDHYEDMNIGALPSGFTYSDNSDFSIENVETSFWNRNPGHSLEINPNSYLEVPNLEVDNYNWYLYKPVLIQFDFGIIGSVSDPAIHIDIQDRSSIPEYFIEINENEMKVCDSMNGYIDFYENFHFDSNHLYNFKLIMKKYEGTTYSTEYMILIDDQIYRFGTAFHISSPLNSMLLRFYGGGYGNFYFDNYYSGYMDGVDTGETTSLQTNRVYLNTLYKSDSTYVKPFMSYDEFTDNDVDISVGLKVSGENIFDSGFGIEGGTAAYSDSIGSEDIIYGGGVDRIAATNEDLVVYTALEADLKFYELSLPGDSRVLFKIPICLNNFRWVFDGTSFNYWNNWGEDSPEPVSFSLANKNDYPGSFPWISDIGIEKDYPLSTYRDITSDSLDFGISLPGLKNVGIDISFIVYTAIILKVGARVNFPPGGGEVDCDLYEGTNPDSVFGLPTYQFENVVLQ